MTSEEKFNFEEVPHGVMHFGDTAFIVLLLNEHGRLTRREIMRRLNEWKERTKPGSGKRSSMALNPVKQYRTHGPVVRSDDGRLFTEDGYLEVHGNPYAQDTEFSLTEKGKKRVSHYVELGRRILNVSSKQSRANVAKLLPLARATLHGDESSKQVLVDALLELNVFPASDVKAIAEKLRPREISKKKLNGWTLNPAWVEYDLRLRQDKQKKTLAKLFGLLDELPDLRTSSMPQMFIDPPPAVPVRIVYEAWYEEGSFVRLESPSATFVGTAMFTPLPPELRGKTSAYFGQSRLATDYLSDVDIDVPPSATEPPNWNNFYIVLPDGSRIDLYGVNYDDLNQ